MGTNVDAVYENGVFKPEQPVKLEERTKVHLTIEPAVTSSNAEDDPTGWQTAMELMGCIKDAPPDLAESHNRYLYGDDARD